MNMNGLLWMVLGFIAAMADKFNEVRTTLVDIGKWKGAA